MESLVVIPYNLPFPNSLVVMSECLGVFHINELYKPALSQSIVELGAALLKISVLTERLGSHLLMPGIRFLTTVGGQF